MTTAPTPPPLRIANPATAQLIEEIPAAPPDAAREAVARARAAQPAWAALPFAARAKALRRLARAVRDDAKLLATLIAEGGQSPYEGEGIEVFYTLEVTRYFTGRAGRRALAEERRRSFVFPNKISRIVRHPLGVVGVIGPWNWPLLCNYADCIAPLVAGNAVVLKPSEHTPLTSLRVAALWRELALPEGVFQVVAGRGDLGAALVEEVDMIFFTGSTRTGRAVAQAAGARLIPAVLELGGKSPMIVLADADLPRAARAAVWSAFAHAGQVCIRTERVLVEAPAADRFVELCAAEVKRLRQGDPGAPAIAPDARARRATSVEVDVGAIVFPPQVAHAEAQIADAVARGGRVVTGGARRTDLGAGDFFAPTLIADANPTMAVMREETFGPVLPVMQVASAEEALRIANDGPTGLSGSVWSRDVARARALALRLEAGSVCVNDALVNYFCIEAPLGGMKASGLGVRHGPEALRQYCRVESVNEDAPLLGRITPWLNRQLGFPYQSRTLRLLRYFMRLVY